MIQNRDPEFRETVYDCYLSIGRARDRVSPEELEGWVAWCRRGDEVPPEDARTKDRLLALFAATSEGQAYAARPKARPVVVPTIDGRDFRDAQGRRTVLLLASGFRFFERLRNGEDVAPLCRQWRDLGFTWIRVFFAYCVDANGNGIGRLIPREYEYADVRRCAEYLNGEGFGLYATAIADAQRVFTSRGEQQDHWLQLGEAIRGTGAVASVGNEHGDWTKDDFSKNGFNPGDFGRIGGVLCSRGAGVVDVPCFPPDMDFAEFRNRRDQPKMELDAVASPVTLYRGETGTRGPVNVPIVFDECTKVGGRFERDGALLKRVAAFYAIEAAGLCFHSPEGIDARLLPDDTAALAKSWNDAARKQLA